MTDPKTLPDRARELRAALGLTQAALANAAGLTTRYVQALEQGTRPRPTYDVFLALASALGVSPEELASPPKIIPKSCESPIE